MDIDIQRIKIIIVDLQKNLSWNSGQYMKHYNAVLFEIVLHWQKNPRRTEKLI